MSDQTRFQQQSGHSESRPAAEWITLVISIAIIATMVGLVSWLYFRGSEEHPAIVAVAKMDDVRERDGRWYLPIEVRNDGDRTVASAIIQGELEPGDGQPQTAEVTVDYLAGGEREQATLVFDDDPRAGDLTIGPTSYLDP